MQEVQEETPKERIARWRRFARNALERAHGFGLTNLEAAAAAEIVQAADLAERLLKQRDDLRACLEHALELGHLGEGSTAGWARDLLQKSEDT